MSEENNGLIDINNTISEARKSAVGNITTTASNAAQQKTQELLAPVNQAALKAAKTIKAIEQTLAAVRDTVNTVIDTGFFIFRVLALGPGILVQEVVKLKKKKIKEILTDIVNGVVKEVKNAVSTLIGAFVNIVEDTIDTIQTSIGNFKATIIGSINSLEESTTEAFNSIKDNIEEEAEVGLISGAASAQVKDAFDNVSNTMLRNFQRDPDLERTFKDTLSVSFIKNIASNMSTFRSSKMAHKEEINRLKFIDNAPVNRPDISISNDEAVQLNEVFDGNQLVQTEDNVDKINTGVAYKQKNRDDNNTLREKYSINEIKGESNAVQSLEPLNEGEFLTYIQGFGLPDRFKNISGVVKLNYSNVFGSRDPNTVRICLVKNNLEIYDERFPEISGKRGENLKRLFDNRIINDNTDVTLYSETFKPPFLDAAFDGLTEVKKDTWNISYNSILDSNLYANNQTSTKTIVGST